MSNNVNIEQLKKERERDIRIMKDKTASAVARMSLPSIVLMVGVMVWSAKELAPEAIAVVATGAEKEDPMLQIARELISHLTEDSSKEIIMDDKSIRIVGKNSKVVQGKNLIYGNDKKLKKK
jgi:Na+-transporting methylmalonyl-CoA/oxaloacetate decarboxylase beta subunit